MLASNIVVMQVWFAFHGYGLTLQEYLQPQPAGLRYGGPCAEWACGTNGPDAFGLRADLIRVEATVVVTRTISSRDDVDLPMSTAPSANGSDPTPDEDGWRKGSWLDQLWARLTRIGSNGPDVNGLRADLQERIADRCNAQRPPAHTGIEGCNGPEVDGMGNNGPQITGLSFETMVDP